MNKTIVILLVLLVVQIALAFGLRYAENLSDSAANQRLIVGPIFGSTTKVTILEKSGKKINLVKVNDGWTLPELYNFPASKENVTRLLDKLKSLSKGWPVATTSDAAPRFKVSNDDFEQKVILSDGTKDLATILIGTTAGYNKVHLRVDKDNDIHTAEIPSHELSTNVEEWIDRDAVTINTDDITKVELPQLTLTKKGKDWELSYGGQTKIVDATTAGEVLDDVANVSVSSVLGTENKPEYGLAAPVLTYTVTLKNGTVLNYSFGKLKDGNFYVLKKPNADFFVKIDSWFIDRVKGKTPASLAERAELLKKARESAKKAEEDAKSKGKSSGSDLKKPGTN